MLLLMSFFVKKLNFLFEKVKNDKNLSFLLIFCTFLNKLTVTLSKIDQCFYNLHSFFLKSLLFYANCSKK